MTSHSIENAAQAQQTAPQVIAYEAPAIESVLTPESLEREVHYAGNIAVSSATPTPPPL